MRDHIGLARLEDFLAGIMSNPLEELKGEWLDLLADIPSEPDISTSPIEFERRKIPATPLQLLDARHESIHEEVAPRKRVPASQIRKK